MSKFTVSFANVDAIASNLSTTVIEELAAQSEAKARIKRGAAWLAFYFLKDWGVETMREFPRVGSKHKPGSNHVSDMNPEEYKKADGTMGERQVSIYAKVWDVSDAGKQHYANVEAHKAAKDTAPDSTEWEIEMNRLTSVRANEINKLKEAFKLFQKIEAVNDNIDDAEAELAMDHTGEQPVKGHNNVILKRIDGPTAIKKYSTGQFLALKLDKCIAEGKTTYAALISTTGKGSGDGPDTFIKPIEKVEQWDQVTAEYCSYLDKVVGDTKKLKDLYTHLNEAGSDGLLLSLDNIYTRIETIIGTPANAARLTKLQEEGGRRAYAERLKANAA
jgi:hypothetical protein